jgi:hypothetical protein
MGVEKVSLATDATVVHDRRKGGPWFRPLRSFSVNIPGGLRSSTYCHGAQHPFSPSSFCLLPLSLLSSRLLLDCWRQHDRHLDIDVCHLAILQRFPRHSFSRARVPHFIATISRVHVLARHQTDWSIEAYLLKYGPFPATFRSTLRIRDIHLPRFSAASHAQ